MTKITNRCQLIFLLSFDANGKKKLPCRNGQGSYILKAFKAYLNLRSSDTVSFFRPFALLRASTLRPFAEAILSLNPCLFLRFLFDG